MSKELDVAVKEFISSEERGQEYMLLKSCLIKVFECVELVEKILKL